LKLLEQKKKVQGQGIEIDDMAVHLCVENGVNVFHGDIDSGLPDYPDQAFDAVILNRTLEQKPQSRMGAFRSHAGRRQVIVGIPNFAHWSSRFYLLFNGKAPVTRTLALFLV